jgi:membrane associated rhomboid family serine protease
MKNQFTLDFAQHPEIPPIPLAKSIVTQMGYRIKNQWRSGLVAEKAQQDSKSDLLYISIEGQILKAEIQSAHSGSADLLELESKLSQSMGKTAESDEGDLIDEEVEIPHTENARDKRDWSFTIPWSKIPFTLSICGLQLIYFTIFFIVAHVQERTLTDLAFNSSAATYYSFVNWEFSRLLLFWLPHFDWIHLLTSIIGFFGLGMILERRLGSALTAFVFFLTGLVGVNVHMVLGQNGIPIMGGSGHVIALLSAVSVYNLVSVYDLLNYRNKNKLTYVFGIFAIPAFIYSVFFQQEYFSVEYFITMCIAGHLIGGLFAYFKSLSDSQYKWLSAAIQTAIIIIAVVITSDRVEYKPIPGTMVDQMIIEKTEETMSEMQTQPPDRKRFDPAVLGKDYEAFKVEMTSIYSMMHMASISDRKISLSRSYRKNLEDKSIYYWKEAHQALGNQLNKDINDLYFEQCKRLQALCKTQLSKCEYIHTCLQSNKMPNENMLEHFDIELSKNIEQVNEIEAVIFQLENL